MTGKTWYIIGCPSLKEVAAEAILHRLGYEETFYPKRWVDARPRGKAKRSTDDKKNRVQRAWVPGYVFLCSSHIEAWRITGTHGKVSLRVLAPGGVPYTVTDKDMALMKDVPSRIKDLAAAAEAAERAARLAKRPVVEERAQIKEGPFSGRSGLAISIFTKIDAGKSVEMVEIEIETDIGSMPVRVPVAYAERVAV